MTIASVGILEIQNRLIAILKGPEFAADLAAARTKYGFLPAELKQPSAEGHDIFRFETLESNAWPYFMVPFERRTVYQWGSANFAIFEFFMRLAVCVRVDGGQYPLAVQLVSAYLDAASATLTRAVREIGAGANIYDARPIESTIGAALASTNGDSIIQFGSISFSVKAKSATENV